MDPLTSLALVGTIAPGARPSAEPGAPVDAVLAQPRGSAHRAAGPSRRGSARRRDDGGTTLVARTTPRWPRAPRRRRPRARRRPPPGRRHASRSSSRAPPRSVRAARRGRGNAFRTRCSPMPSACAATSCAGRYAASRRARRVARPHERRLELGIGRAHRRRRSTSWSVRGATRAQPRGASCSCRRGALDATACPRVARGHLGERESRRARRPPRRAAHGNLGARDEAFIEAQLGDRASAVREAAQALLPHLPESAFVRRMIARADAMIDFKRSALAFGRASAARSRATPAGECRRRGGARRPACEAAARDRGARRPDLLADARASPPSRSLIGPTRFGRRPDQLVAAAEASDWASAVCEGWTRAAARQRRRPNGSAPSGTFWQRSDEKAVTAALRPRWHSPLLRRMPAG